MDSNNELYNVVRFYVTDSDQFREDSYGMYKYKACAIKKANKIKKGCIVMQGSEIVYPSTISEIMMTVSPELIKD